MYAEQLVKLLVSLRDLNTASITVRLVLAALCGGLIGMERMYKHRPAGIRTHMLICLGAAMTTLTSQYLYLERMMFTDMARLGAQVVSGIVFIGAGTIIVTKSKRVKGLTTAAGLWTAAIIGLACGAGYYEGAFWATALVLLAELVFSKVEYYMMANSREAHLYLQYDQKESLERVLEWFRNENIRLLNMQITRPEPDDRHSAYAICSLRLNQKWDKYKLRSALDSMEGILSVEEM